MAADPRDLYNTVASEMVNSSLTVTGKLFGMPCLKTRGKTYAGFVKNAMVFKLNNPALGEALNLEGVCHFDPSGNGRPMKECVVVPVDHADR